MQSWGRIRIIRLKEELSSTVKERQRLKESERILVQTFDTLRMHYEQSRECVQCKQCGLSFISESEMKKHQQSSHTQKFTHMFPF